MLCEKYNTERRFKNIRKYFEKNRKFKLLIYIFLWIFVFIITPILLSLNFINSVFYISVSSNSMNPTIIQNDKVIVSRINKDQKIKRNDIIVFYSKEIGRMLVKRVVGIPGDVIYIDEEFNLLVNGNEIIKNSNVNLPYEYNYDDIQYNSRIIVPNEAYFVIGDNFNNSFDSRFWKNKFVLKEFILGKAILLISPLKRFSIF